MLSPGGTLTPVSSVCGSETPTALMSPGTEAGFMSPSADGGFLTSRHTPAVINDHIRFLLFKSPQVYACFREPVPPNYPLLKTLELLAVQVLDHDTYFFVVLYSEDRISSYYIVISHNCIKMLSI